MKEKPNLLRFPRGSGRVVLLKMNLLSVLLFFVCTVIAENNHTANNKDRQLVHFKNIEKLSSSETHVPRQQGIERVIKGKVVGEDNEPIPGVNVHIKGTTVGTITDSNGDYQLKVSGENEILVFSFIGMLTQEIPVSNNLTLNVTLKSEMELLEDVVVVGYGIQKKESVVGSIAQVKGDDLQKAGGVASVGQALEGQVAGMVTMFTNGQPGEEESRIVLRGQSSWNNSAPLILVDGVERNMNEVDMNAVESISVLKDASATAVYGVKGGNGVILITTKRGKEGKAQLSFSGNVTGKSISKVPEKYDAYDAMMITNEAVMRELPYQETAWGSYTPVQIAEKYRNQTTQLEREIYPNVDWKDYMFKDMATDYRFNTSVRGGSKSTKYFVNIAYQHEGDIVKQFDNDKGYDAKSTYDRFTYRSNLDFKLSNTTKLAVNLSGLYGIQNYPKGDPGRIYLGIYNLAPDVYYPRYSDGAYGWSGQNDFGTSNSLYYYTSTGMNTQYRFSLNSDFELQQDLGFITKGLNFKARFTLDNRMHGLQEIEDRDNAIFKVYFNDGQDILWDYPDVQHDYEYVLEPWELSDFKVGSNKTRRLDYQLTLNYNRSFGVHRLGGLFLFKRQEYASGNMFPRYSEDWVGRLTYDYKNKYLLEANGAYNGSEKFGPGYRFDLFPSIALGWVISNESFMQGIDWIDQIKVRGSYGIVGDDGFDGRWLYVSQWGTSNHSSAINTTYFNTYRNGQAASPYSYYYEDQLANEEAHWETAEKLDFGIEMSFLRGAITLDADYFKNNRSDIWIDGDDRSVPDLFGANPPGGNLGEVEVKGYEIELGLTHKFENNGRIWTRMAIGHAKDKVINREDPALTPDYQKQAGYSIGQRRIGLPTDIMQSWDDVYMSTPLISGDRYKRTGYYDMVDYNGDGDYNGTFDVVPYGYPNRPQNTYSWMFGGDYKGLSLSVQFYGQQNSIRNQHLNTFPLEMHNIYKDNGDYWSKDNPDAERTLYPWTLRQASSDPLYQLRDGTTIRLKMVELAYRLPKKACNKIGVEGLRIFANGNNLYLWTEMADDRDFSQGNRGDYPTMKRFNLGFTLDL